MKNRIVKTILGILGIWGMLTGRAWGVEINYPWVVENFNSEITIDKNTTVEVKETINADFRILQKHGIYRTIPVKYKDRYGNNLDIRFKLISITDRAGRSIDYSQSREGNNVQLKIGDAERTVSGKQTYAINYQIKRVITQPNQDAELYWNVTGNNWEVPILFTKVTVKAPEGSIKDTICFSGMYGAKEQECDHDYQGGTAKFETKTMLRSGAGLTIGVAMNPSKLEIPTTGQKTIWFLQDNWLYGVPFWVLILMLRIYWLKGRDKQYKNMFNDSGDVETVPWLGKLNIPNVYAPIKKISAGESGVLVDEKADLRDVTAVIIDLARRGYFIIKETGKKGLFSKVKFELIWNNKDESDLKSYEISALDMLFGKKRKASVMTNDLPEKSYQYLAETKTNLYKYLVESGYFLGSPDKTRLKYLMIGIGVAMGGLVFTGIGAVLGSAMGWAFACLGSGTIIFIFSFFMPARTARGRKILREVVGMKEWVRIGAWREQIHEKHNFFEEVLPFAIAFNMTDKFVKAFNEADIKNLSWYQSNNVFNAMYFTNSISHFNSSVSSGVAATMPRSASSGGSAFSGGGSGGGFSGGGGGSW